MSGFGFEVGARSGAARTGAISTPHGEIHTPAFIPVGTKATVKALLPETVRDLGAQAVLANAYHLYLQPGSDVVHTAGGLGSFMNWPGPTFTDSGGFQVMSLGVGFKKVLAMDAGRVTDDEVRFLADVGAVEVLGPDRYRAAPSVLGHAVEVLRLPVPAEVLTGSAEIVREHEAGRRDSYAAANRTIHRTIVLAARNVPLAEVHAALLSRADQVRVFALGLEDRWEQSIREHQAILDALDARDPLQAGRLLQEHVGQTAAVVTTSLAGRIDPASSAA